MTLALMATLPGIALYERFGFQVMELVDITLPDGVRVGCVANGEASGFTTSDS